jgi:hypothetical protein
VPSKDLVGIGGDANDRFGAHLDPADILLEQIGCDPQFGQVGHDVKS